MNRNPSNTAVFLICRWFDPTIPSYQDHIRDIVKKLQQRGYEPYVYSNNVQLLEEANLFIRKETGNLTVETIPFWKKHNIILTDAVDIIEDYFDLFITNQEIFHRYFGSDPCRYPIALLFDNDTDILQVALADELSVNREYSLWITTTL